MEVFYSHRSREVEEDKAGGAWFSSGHLDLVVPGLVGFGLGDGNDVDVVNVELALDERHRILERQLLVVERRPVEGDVRTELGDLALFVRVRRSAF